MHAALKKIKIDKMLMHVHSYVCSNVIYLYLFLELST